MGAAAAVPPGARVFRVDPALGSDRGYRRSGGGGDSGAYRSVHAAVAAARLWRRARRQGITLASCGTVT